MFLTAEDHFLLFNVQHGCWQHSDPGQLALSELVPKHGSGVGACQGQLPVGSLDSLSPVWQVEEVNGIEAACSVPDVAVGQGTFLSTFSLLAWMQPKSALFPLFKREDAVTPQLRARSPSFR